MSYKIKGTITTITAVETLDNGAKKLSYRINTGEAYNAIYEFEMYNNEANAKFTDDFVTFNKVGDLVDVEFQIRPRVWEEKDRVFTTLSHWKCSKSVADGGLVAPVAESADLPF